MTQRDFRFGPLAAPIRFEDADDVAEIARAQASGWTIVPWDGMDIRPLIVVRRAENGFILSSPWSPEPESYRTPTGIVCAFLSDLVMAYAAHRDDLVFLHAGAVAFDDALVVFPSPSKAGKSTLAAVAAAHRGRVYSDDTLAYDLATGTAFALGIAPRPRLPFPSGLRPATRAFLDSHVRIAGKYFASLAFDARHLAPFGARATIRCVVSLERIEGDLSESASGLFPASRAATMALLIEQRFGAEPPGAALVAAMDRLTSRAPCLTLRYRDPDEGAELLAVAARKGSQTSGVARAS